MPASGKRRDAMRKALRLLIPGAPFDAFSTIHEAALEPQLKALPPAQAAWLAMIAWVRHNRTAYDELLNEGYDRDAARHFVVDEINAVLTGWRATRMLSGDADELDPI